MLLKMLTQTIKQLVYFGIGIMPLYDNFNIKAVEVNKVLSKMIDKEKLFFLNHSNINLKIHLNKS